MKMKMIVLLAVAALAAIGVSAAPAAGDVQPADRWTPFQLGFLPGFPAAMETSNVYGIKTGWPMVDGRGRVRGLEASWLYSGTADVIGAQGSFVYCQSRRMYGIQAALGACTNLESFYGLQSALGVCVNLKGFLGLQAALAYCHAGDFKGVQASALNISGNATGLQAAAICNVSGEVRGFQASLVANVTKKFTGIQTSFYNQASTVKGAQIGLVNISEGKGFQIGLVNYIEDAAFQYFPLVNFAF